MQRLIFNIFMYLLNTTIQYKSHKINKLNHTTTYNGTYFTIKKRAAGNPAALNMKISNCLKKYLNNVANLNRAFTQSLVVGFKFINS